MPTTSLTYQTGDGARIALAVGRRDGLKDGNGVTRSATMAEVKTHISAYLDNLVIEEETAIAREAITRQPDIVIT